MIAKQRVGAMRLDDFTEDPRRARFWLRHDAIRAIDDGSSRAEWEEDETVALVAETVGITARELEAYSEMAWSDIHSRRRTG